MWLVLSGHNGGCHPDDGPPRPSPAHALALVLETDGTIEAELVLITTSTPQPVHIAGASTVSVTDPAGTNVTLAGDDFAYAADDAALLHYQAAAPFTFRFSIDASTAVSHHVYEGSFELVLHGGADAPEAWLDGEPGDGDEVVVEWQPSGMHAVIDVRNDAGEVTAGTLDWSEPAIDSRIWRSLPFGGRHTLAASAFPASGAYTVRVCCVELMRRIGSDGRNAAPQHLSDADGMSADLGWLSGGLAGRCAVLAVDVLAVDVPAE